MDRRIEDYFAYLDAVRGLSPCTLRSYREDFESFLKICGSAKETFDIDRANASDIRAFAAALVTEGKAGSSVNRALSALRGYFRYRVRYGGLFADPSRDVEGLSAKRPLPRFLFENEAAAFLSLPKGDGFAPSRDRAMLEFLYSTGCRVAEASNLTLDRLDLAGGSARVIGKGSKERVVFLADPAREAIGRYLPLRSERARRLFAGTGASPIGKSGERKGPSEEYLFMNARGGRLTERGFEWIIQGYVERSGSPRSVTPHTFRHSFATHLVGRGADIRAVQELLGHASISTTQIYAHVDMERLRKVYEQAHPHSKARVVRGKDRGE